MHHIRDILRNLVSSVKSIKTVTLTLFCRHDNGHLSAQPRIVLPDMIVLPERLYSHSGLYTQVSRYQNVSILILDYTRR